MVGACEGEIMSKKILIACEFSGRVRNAFAERGHNAWSCDLLPTEIAGNHYQGDVLDILNDGWDMMIAHPPCTYLSNAGVAHFNVKKYGEKAKIRRELRREAFDFFMKLINAPIPKIAVENPAGYPNVHYRKPDQIIHPYYFGDAQLKRTCLWLKGLPKLWYWLEDDLFGKRTAVDRPQPVSYDNTPRKRARYFVDGSTRNSYVRSKTFPAIALAMAEQWG